LDSFIRFISKEEFRSTERADTPTLLLLRVAYLTIILKLLPKLQAFMFIFDKLWPLQTDTPTLCFITQKKNEFKIQEDIP
jgi:hypothetical protein